MGIFTKPYNAAISELREKTLALCLERKHGKISRAIQTNNSGFGEKRSYHFLHQQGRHGLPTMTETLHVPHRENPRMLSRLMAHDICRQQILH